MATYTNLTNEQQITLEYLFNRAKSVKKRIKDEDVRLIDDPDVLKQELLSIQKEINEVLSARDEYEFHIQAAAKHIDAAEACKKKWGF